MAGAEGEARLDLDGQLAAVALPAVMCAVDEETAGAHRLQTLQRTHHPIDIRHRLARNRPRQGQPGKNVFQARLDGIDIAVGIERHFMDIAVLVDFDQANRQALIFERRFERGEDTVGLDLASCEIKPRLGHQTMFFVSMILSENRLPLYAGADVGFGIMH
jgi:hypothetical protein